MAADIEPPSISSFITNSELQDQLWKIEENQDKRYSKLKDELTELLKNELNDVMKTILVEGLRKELKDELQSELMDDYDKVKINQDNKIVMSYGSIPCIQGEDHVSAKIDAMDVSFGE